MDILNWLYLRKNQLIRKTVSNPAADLVVLGGDTTFAKRDDKYKTYAMTVEDFATAVALPPAYKVYTALLTQSGGDNFQELVGSGSLTIGTTYYIINDGGNNFDFTNVGAPNNDFNTYFVATGTTPNSWGVDCILGYNTGAPVVTVLENTIGNVWFTYLQVGYYNINSNGLFTTGKTAWFNQGFPNDDNSQSMLMYFNTESQFGISTRVDLGTPSDNALYIPTPIEIRVYD